LSYDKQFRSRGLAAGSSGIILIVVGVVILLDHLGYVQARHLWIFWPLILVFAGVVRLSQQGHRGFGILLILFGGMLQLNTLGILHFSWDLLWPLGLIGFGILKVWERFGKNNPSSTSAVGKDFVNELAFFGGVERRLNIKDFRGGNISAIFGGVELDFRSAEMAENEAVLELEAIFGGVELVVPMNWTVVFQGESIFGGYSDETLAPVAGNLQGAPNKTLIVRGRSIFGGVSVKN
jgi:predicted membrane protein